MTSRNDFTQGLREEPNAPAVGGADLWPKAEKDSVVQRDLTQPLAGGSAARDIKLSALKPDPKQPRRTFGETALNELADSIRENGVLQPITVTWSTAEGSYLIVTGERRYQAAIRAGLATVPAIIRPETFDAKERLQQQLVENIQREGIPPIEEAIAIKTLMESLDLSQRAVAKKLGKPQTYVAELLQILRLPDPLLQQAAKLPKHALVEASRVHDPKAQETIIRQALSSAAPFRAIKQARADAEPRARVEYFKKTFITPGVGGSVSVTLRRHPEEVTTEDVVQVLIQTARALVDDEKGRS